MPRPFLRPAIALAILLMAGCTSGTGDDTAASATPAPISVTALPPAAGTSIPAAAPADKVTDTAGDAPGEPADAVGQTEVAADPDPDAAPEAADTVADTATETAVETAAPEAVPPPLSPAALACQKNGGQFVGTGRGDLKACVQPTGEGTRRCTRQTDCKAQCLAQSGTCSPITPLFGCNDILDTDGRRVTLCIN